MNDEHRHLNILLYNVFVEIPDYLQDKNKRQTFKNDNHKFGLRGMCSRHVIPKYNHCQHC